MSEWPAEDDRDVDVGRPLPRPVPQHTTGGMGGAMTKAVPAPYAPPDHTQTCSFCHPRGATSSSEMVFPPPDAGVAITRAPSTWARFKAWWLERWHAGQRAARGE